MRILLGTTNPSKARRFEELLAGLGLTFVTLRDIHISGIPRETGRDPEENARIKAAYYAQFFDPVITADSALYIRELPPDDARQPGLFVRRAPDGRERTDEQMLEEYARLAHSLGGRMTCYYQNAAAISYKGYVSSFMDTGAVNDVYAFDMVQTPHTIRHPGWPLDSLSIDRHTGLYFVEPVPEDMKKILSPQEERIVQAHERAERMFLQKALGISV